MSSKRSTSGPGSGWLRSRWLLLALVLAALAAVAVVVVVGPFWRLTSQFDDITYRQPSRLYARPTRLAEGAPCALERLLAELKSAGYREAAGEGPLPVGRYRKIAGGLAVHRRNFPLPPAADGQPEAEPERGGGVAEIKLHGSRIAALRLDGRAVETLALEPALLASYYGPDFKERRPVAVGEVPQDLVGAVLAAEDEGFFTHAGISVTGVVRAAWVDVRGHGIRQGGSTLTQQLVKNLYLTQERTVTRKLREVLLTLLLESRFGKKQILEAYLNEIYLGASSGVNLMGVGAAARAYFGKDVGQLTLPESAVLAGMISAPAVYSPIDHPDRARERRDWVLSRMAKLRLVDAARAERAMAAALAVAPEPVVRRRTPYFADAAAEEAERRFGVAGLEDAGYTLFSTLDWRDQQAAQRAVETGLASLEKGRRRKDAPLQAALVSVDPESGGIVAYVGGRQYAASQFDRAGQAHRQVGSAFKPIVYAAAFERKRAVPATFLDDSPLTVRVGNRSWTPKNDDGDFHGTVSARTALEHSYNLATARLALQVGLPPIVELAREMGIGGTLEAFPSVALGAASVTPVELATVYATFARGGVRPPVHALVAIRDRHGKAVPAAALPSPERVLSPQSAYLVTSMLQGVLDHGTGYAARALGVEGELAGKTGTTNDQRDSWFAGYSPDRATVVWVGYDDNAPTGLSGSRGALPIWSRFTVAVRPPGGYRTFNQPAGISTAVIDPATGLLATEYCPSVLTEVFPTGQVPTDLCNQHQGWSPELLAQASAPAGDERAEAAGRGEDSRAERGDARDEEREPPRAHPFRSWLRRVFGLGSREAGRPAERDGRNEREDRRRDDRRPPERERGGRESDGFDDAGR
jgi:penicillin-binding protein 1B